MVCLALELGPWVALGFSVGMEAFDEATVKIRLKTRSRRLKSKS